jgi:hypothetical protein
MKELTLSVNTGGEGKDNTVVCTAKFATHDEAVAFHASVAKLCGDAAKSGKITDGWDARGPLMKMLTKS